MTTDTNKQTGDKSTLQNSTLEAIINDRTGYIRPQNSTNDINAQKPFNAPSNKVYVETKLPPCFEAQSITTGQVPPPKPKIIRPISSPTKSISATVTTGVNTDIVRLRARCKVESIEHDESLLQAVEKNEYLLSMQQRYLRCDLAPFVTIIVIAVIILGTIYIYNYHIDYLQKIVFKFANFFGINTPDTDHNTDNTTDSVHIHNKKQRFLQT